MRRQRGLAADGIFCFHDFHSTTHEAPGIVAGEALVMLGGPSGRHFKVRPGRVLSSCRLARATGSLDRASTCW
jgi:uncharacterized protein YjlB